MSRKEINASCLLISIIVFGNNQLSVAAQQFQRYPTDSELEPLFVKLSQSMKWNENSMPGNVYVRDRRTDAQKEAIQSFSNAWSVASPDAAPFLGQWSGYEDGFAIYPSQTPNRVCIIRTGEGLGRFMLGNGSNGKIYTNENSIIFRQGRYLGEAAIRNGQPTLLNVNLVPLISYRPIEPPEERIRGRVIDAQSRAEILRQYRNAGCTTEIPTGQKISTNPASTLPVKQTDAIARYPTNDDFNAFDRTLQTVASNPESLVKLNGNQLAQRRKFQKEWEGRNPAAAKFLGAWYTGDRYFYVFPSSLKGGTCVVTQDAQGNLNMQIGTVLNRELRYGGGKGLFWVDRDNIVASRDSGSGSLYPIYATTGIPKLTPNIIGDMERQKCITSLPF